MGGSARTSRPGPWQPAPRHVIVAFLLIGAAAAAAGCGSDTADEPSASVSTDAVLTALVDWTVAQDAPATTGDDEPPVVYITASNGDTIDAAVQASVVAATADDATVRFADDRSEAIDDTTDDQSVHDDGVLLVVGELPAEPPLADVSVERYRSVDDASAYLVTLVPDGDGASVSAAIAE